MNDRPTIYDRQMLLSGARRNVVLDLSEVQRYGSDSYGDADYVSVYGMRPADWYAAGVRLLGRTAVECTRDKLADAIGRDIAAVAGSAPGRREMLVIDLFAGSCNTLYWVLRHLPAARGSGFELDTTVFQLTRQNLAALSSPIEIANIDYVAGLDGVTVSSDRMIIVFVAPPWGDALDQTSGLDLRRTSPPIADIVDLLIDRFPQNRLLLAVQVYETVDAVSLAELEPRFDWSVTRIYDLNEAGLNHGILLAARGWIPSPMTPDQTFCL